ncbi:MAG: hypothetical protein Q4G58_18000 [bacterium]|nr:hypothetical protein [bacterium]
MRSEYMMDEDFLKRKEVVWYKRILIGAVLFAIMVAVAAGIMCL